MATLSIPQIAQLAANVGVPNGAPMYVCVSIALAESGGRTDAVNVANSNGTVDRGLWQINSVHDEKMPGRDRFDPNVNAQLMAQISSQGTNWQPWSTYNNNAYQSFMAEVTAALGGTALLPDATVGDAGVGAGNGFAVSNASLVTGAQNAGLSFGGGLDAIEKFFRLITSAEGWLRILKVYSGVVLVIAGIVLIMGTSKTGKAAIGVATNFVPGGAALKGAKAAKGAKVAATVKAAA